MMFYRDKTFCTYLQCADKECNRRLTDEIKQKAREWWGKDNPPICVFAARPECFIDEKA
jgi:hypothetical protein